MTRRERQERERLRWRAFIKPQWSRLKAALTPREARVLELRLAFAAADSPVTQVQIAQRLGVSVLTVAAIEKSARAKVRRALKEGSDGTA